MQSPLSNIAAIIENTEMSSSSVWSNIALLNNGDLSVLNAYI